MTYIPAPENCTLTKEGRFYIGFKYTEPKEHSGTGRPQTRPRRFGKGVVISTEREAMRAVRDMLAGWQAQVSATEAAAAENAPTIQQVCDWWLDEKPAVRRKGGSSNGQQENVLKAVCGVIGTDACTTMTKDGVNAFIKAQLKKFSSDTVRLRVEFLLSALRSAENDGKLPAAYRTPLSRKVDLPPRVPRIDNRMDEDQYEAAWELIERVLADTTRPTGYNARRTFQSMRMRAMFAALALETGARAMSLSDFRWSKGQVDFRNRMVHLNPNGRDQNTKYRASQPMSDRLFRLLTDWRKDQMAHGLLGEFVIAGAKMAENVCSVGAMREFWKLAGIKGDGFDMTRHDLRRTFTQTRLAAGVDLNLVAELIGDDAKTVRKHYGRFVPSNPEARAAVEVGSKAGKGSGTK